MVYSVLDIETTGGNYKSDRITEIAIYRFDGDKITDEFSSLVNPERNIPYFITGLTGITNSMVKDAPKFYEIAKEIVELTKDSIVVGHNVNFDYNFIKEEFKNLGYDWQRERLDTVKLARKVIPGHKSYGLGKICPELGIGNNARHRAAGDAFATLELLKLLLNKANNKTDVLEVMGLTTNGLNPELDLSTISNIPEKPGVYFFHNEKTDIIYIGKSKDLNKRVKQHLSNSKTNRAQKMKSEICSISFEVTGSDLVAKLYESHLIKKYKPLYNRAQRRTGNHYALLKQPSEFGYFRLFIDKTKDNEESVVFCFETKSEAENYLRKLVNDFELCLNYTSKKSGQNSCFNHQVGLCKGACVGDESPELYNLRVDEALENFKIGNDSFYIYEIGRDSDENAVVKIQNGRYIGWGFLSSEIIASGNNELIDECINCYDDNREIQSIITNYLSAKKKR